jgi:hypothetical protein
MFEKHFWSHFKFFFYCIPVLAFSYISYHITSNTWKFKSSVEVYPIILHWSTYRRSSCLRDLTHRCMMVRGVKLQFRQPHEFETRLEKNLGYESGAQGGTYGEWKNGDRKSRATVYLIVWRGEYKFKTVQFCCFPLKFFDVQALFSSALEHCNELFLKIHAFTL